MFPIGTLTGQPERPSGRIVVVAGRQQQTCPIDPRGIVLIDRSALDRRLQVGKRPSGLEQVVGDRRSALTDRANPAVADDESIELAQLVGDLDGQVIDFVTFGDAEAVRKPDRGASSMSRSAR